MGEFRQHKLRYYLNTHWHEIDLVITCWGAFFVFVGIGWIWSTHVEVHLLFSLPLDGLGQHMVICILSLGWHARVNTWWDAFITFAGIEWAWANTLCPRLNWMSFVNTCWDSFCVLAGLRWIWPTHIVILFCVLARIRCVWSSRVEMHFMYSAA